MVVLVNDFSDLSVDLILLGKVRNWIIKYTTVTLLNYGCLD